MPTIHLSSFQALQATAIPIATIFIGFLCQGIIHRWIGALVSPLAVLDIWSSTSPRHPRKLALKNCRTAKCGIEIIGANHHGSGLSANTLSSFDGFVDSHQ